MVSGLPRSGTSLMMMMLEAAGIPPLTDRTRAADEDNPKGYYEFERVKKMKDGDMGWIREAPGKAVKIISALLPNLPNNYTYQVLFMLRELPEILASQRVMLANRGEDPSKISDEAIASSFERHLVHVRHWLDNKPNFSTHYVDYNLLLENPEPAVEAIIRFLDRNMDKQAMISAIDPKLYRQRKYKDVAIT